MRFAVIGCGTIAQIMHLPHLVELPSTEVGALVDPARNRVERLGDRYGVDGRFQDVDTMLDDVGGDLDCAVVCTPSHTHADVVERTLAADLHTLVEKPIAATPGGADRIVEAADGSDAVAMVAYMKRYARAYERAAGAIDELAAVDLVTAYDVDPDHGRIIDEVYDLVAADLPEEFVAEAATERRSALERAVGTDDDALVDAYDFQLEHVCHDVNVLRGLFGEVAEIHHADLVADGRYMTARLEYENGVACVLESGDSERKWFEEFVRVDGPDGMVTLEFSNPFIRNSPAELRHKRGREELADTVETPGYDESFKRELAAFVDCVRGDREVRTPVEEARDDLALIIDLFGHV
jgi:predicted dehydrogenase